MKRTFKKAFAALTATAIAASSFAVTSFAAPVAKDITSESAWVMAPEDVDLSTVGTKNVADVTSVIVSITMADRGWGWANAQVYTNSAEGGTGWVQATVGTTDHADANASFDYSVGLGEKLDIELALTTDYWYNVGVNAYSGSWLVNSVTFMSGDEVYYEYTVADEEDPDTTIQAAYKGSTTIESTGSYWNQYEISKADLLGDVAAEDVVKIRFKSEIFSFIIGYNGHEITGENADGSVSYWNQLDAATEFVLTSEDITFDENYGLNLILSSGDKFAADVSWTVYTKAEEVVEDEYAYTNSTDIEAAGEYWDVTTIGLADLIGDIDPTTIEKIVFESDNNFALGYNSTEAQKIDEETGIANYWVTADTGNSYEITDMDLSIPAEYFSMQIIGRVETGTTTVTWKVYTKPALVESLNGTSVTLGDTIGVNLYLDLGEELLADDEAVVEYFFANGDCYNDLISYGEATDNGYKFTVNIDAKKMADEFTAQVVAGDGRRGELYTVSVKEYADQIINAEEGTYSDETIALVKAMLVYGGYAQEYFDYNTDNLASAGLDTDVSSARITNSFEALVDGTLPEGMSFYGTSLILEGKTTLRLYFTASDELAEAYGLIANGDYYCYDIANINVSELDTDHEVTFGDCTIYCSALSYAYRAINGGTDNEELINLVKALRLYNVAANSYVAA